MGADFKVDPHFADAVLRSEALKDVLEELVPEAAELAAELAPDDPATTRNDLPRSVFGDVALTAEHGWVGRVGATNFKAAWYEEGAQGVTPEPYLRPAVEATFGAVEAAPEE